MTCHWSFKTVWKASVVSIHYFSLGRCQGWLSKCLDEGSCCDGLLLLHPQLSVQMWGSDVRVGFPSALMRVVAVMAFFCSIHSFLCKCGDRMERLDRHLTSEGCNTFSMAKTSVKAQCAPYYKNTIT